MQLFFQTLYALHKYWEEKKMPNTESLRLANWQCIVKLIIGSILPTFHFFIFKRLHSISVFVIRTLTRFRTAEGLIEFVIPIRTKKTFSELIFIFYWKKFLYHWQIIFHYNEWCNFFSPYHCCCWLWINENECIVMKCCKKTYLFEQLEEDDDEEDDEPLRPRRPTTPKSPAFEADWDCDCTH